MAAAAAAAGGRAGGYTGRNCTAQLQHRHHGNEECHEELTEKSIE